MNIQIIKKVLLRGVSPEDKDFDPIKYAFMIGQSWRKQNQQEIRRKVLTGWSEKSKSQEQNNNNLHLNGQGLDGLIKDAIALALWKNKGHREKTATDLKISRGTVFGYVKKWPEIDYVPVKL
jgi:transcriptional regulator with PAS, ATPase and Fis domain